MCYHEYNQGLAFTLVCSKHSENVPEESHIGCVAFKLSHCVSEKQWSC